MNRRSFVLASMAATSLGSSALALPDQKPPAWFELRFYHLSYPSLAAMESALEKMAKDNSWIKALDRFDRDKGIAYTRIESRLLRAFASVPALEIPALEPGGPSHVFELRIYEARNMRALETKIKMFDDDEVTIFRRCGLLPVFFGKTVIGSGLPSLTYMLAYASVEAREEAWRKFLSDPDWIKLRAKPELADREIVSNIHSYFLRPTNYSPIR